ncbi:MAG: hypothetical protein H6766_07085 [Candidatus Peribacteria bacterium]|nr:MAG: hypothetical protein H6766_07085 [Candidatus Peribacteria bacterium]
MDPHTGEIIFLTAGYEVVGLWPDHYLRRVIRDVDTDTPLFEVTLPLQSITDAAILHPAYTWQSVSLGDFVQCLTYDNQCIVARDTENHLVIPAPYNYAYYATYGFDTDTDQIQMTIVRQSDDQPVARLVTESVDLLPSTN